MLHSENLASVQLDGFESSLELEPGSKSKSGVVIYN